MSNDRWTADDEIVRRIADGENPWEIDPEHGCVNPLTGYYPTNEVQQEIARRLALPGPEERLAITDEMVERAARSIINVARSQRGLPPLDELWQVAGADAVAYHAQARAALEAALSFDGGKVPEDADPSDEELK